VLPCLVPLAILMGQSIAARIAGASDRLRQGFGESADVERQTDVSTLHTGGSAGSDERGAGKTQ